MIIGIDLGTTNSLVSYFTEEGPKIIPNRLNKNLTPSVVSIDENGQVFVGETARERQAIYPGSSASVFKRSMGSDKKFRLNDKEYTAEELSSFVLRALKEDAEAYLGQTAAEAVISVPAYFNDARRRATKRAGELAGFKVDRIISEPTAAAIAHGLYQKKENTKFLVFDLGGGTFDVSILELYHNILEVHAVAGDNFLGGEDFTNALVQMFLKEKGLTDRLFDQRSTHHMISQAEQCKIGFSTAARSLMRCQIDGEWLELEISLEDYEKAVQPLLERIRKPIKRSLADSNVKLSEIDEIAFVGGATKLPIIKRFVSKLFERILFTSENPDEAVALGAAIQAAMKGRNEAVKEVILTDVCPFTLGTEVVVEREGGWIESGHFCPIIERNTVIPASRTERLYPVRDNQTQMRINILQGESRFAANNLSLGELIINVPKNKAGEEGVDVTYTYDINSILEVEAVVLSTGRKKKQIIKGSENSMTDLEVQARMEELSYLKIHPRKQEENKLLLLKGERLYEESSGVQRRRIQLMLQEFEAILDSQEPERIGPARKEFEKRLQEEQDAINEF